MKKIYLISLITFILMNKSFSQNTYTTEQDVYEAKELTFYGYDFSHLKLSKTKRLDEDFSKQIILWISFCQHITDEKLAAWFKKEKVTSKTLNVTNPFYLYSTGQANIIQ